MRADDIHSFEYLSIAFCASTPNFRDHSTHKRTEERRARTRLSSHLLSTTASTLIHQRPMGLDIHHTPSIHAQSLRPSPPSDERPSLPSIGLNISRPSSRLSTTSTRSLSSGYYEIAARQNVQLPGLSALASIAANTPPPERHLYVLCLSCCRIWLGLTEPCPDLTLHNLGQ